MSREINAIVRHWIGAVLFIPASPHDLRVRISLAAVMDDRPESGGMGSPFRDHVVPDEAERFFSPLPHSLKTEVKGRYDAVAERRLQIPDW